MTFEKCTSEMTYEEMEKYVEKLVAESLVREFKKLDIKQLNREAKKEFEKICRWNRLLGFTDDKKYIIHFQQDMFGENVKRNGGCKNGSCK